MTILPAGLIPPQPAPDPICKWMLLHTKNKKLFSPNLFINRNSIGKLFELFVLSIIQEDVFSLRKSSCSVCESSVRLGCLVPPSVCHIKIKTSRQVLCLKIQQASFPACSHTIPISERQAGKLRISFFKVFGMIRLGK